MLSPTKDWAAHFRDEEDSLHEFIHPDQAENGPSATERRWQALELKLETKLNTVWQVKHETAMKALQAAHQAAMNTMNTRYSLC